LTRFIRILGSPSIVVDSEPVRGPRGRKSWALLALLVLLERPPSRQRLCRLLFPDADDPLGALRWSLAELRRALGGSETITGDPVTLSFPEGTTIDVDLLRGAPTNWLDGNEVPGELLSGMSFAGCDAFETWLLVERRRLAASVEAIIHEQGLAKLGAGRPREAAQLAATLVELNPYEEGHHVLLVRSLAVSGERRAAGEAAAAASSMFRRELGVEPSPAIREAASVPAGLPSAPASAGLAAARAQLEAGRAAISAGAVDAGIDCLRRCVDELRVANDGALLVAALSELGGALVHAVRGRDEEGAAVLHEAVERASSVDSGASAKALRELGFVDVQAGRRDRAAVWLERARVCADKSGDDVELAAIAGVDGMNLSDQARYPEALEVLTESVERALHAGSRRQAAWSSSLVGRLHFLREDFDEADRAVAQSLQLVKSERWVAFWPWPEAFGAELDMVHGRETVAEQRLAEAFALACQLGDPCWEGVTARAIGLLEARRNPDLALTTLLDARARCARWPDAYQWVHGYVLDAVCTVAVETDSPDALTTANDLLGLAARADMRELVSRAQFHRASLGVPGADEAAVLAGADIDNPALRRATSQTW
jgi:DNA-binding SARP family transcriptional activator